MPIAPFLRHRNAPYSNPWNAPPRHQDTFPSRLLAVDLLAVSTKTGLDGPLDEEQTIENLDHLQSQRNLEVDADQKVTLEDFLKWANDSQLDLDQLRQDIRRRESEPTIKTQPMNLVLQQRSSTAPQSRSISRSSKTSPRRTAESALRKIITADGNASKRSSGSLPGSPRIKFIATRRLSKAVRSTIHPIKRVASMRVRRRHSNPPPPSAIEARPRDLPLRRRPSLASDQILACCAHTQPHNRSATQPHVSQWARNVRRASSTTTVPAQLQHVDGLSDRANIRFQSADDGKCDSDIVRSNTALHDGTTYFRCHRLHVAPPPIEALDDDVSSSYSGALDLLTAEEYLRQTAFDGLDACKFLDAGRSGSDLDV